MPKGVIFWVLMILWLFLGLYSSRAEVTGGRYSSLGFNLLLFVLLFILGWQAFGFVVQ